MMISFSKAWKVFLALILAGTVLVPAACSGGSSQNLIIDSPAPDFKLRDLAGNPVSSGSFRGKTLIINFWATTCPQCVDEMPYFQELHSSRPDQDPVILMINMGESRAVVEEFLRNHRFTFPVLLDSQYEVAGKYSIRYTPTTFFISPEGLIKLRVIGPFNNKSAIEKQLASLST